MRAVFNYAATILLTLFWATLGILTMPLSPRGGLYLLYARIWSRMVLAVSGVRLVKASIAPLDPRKGPYLFMTNHASHFDILSLFAALPLPVRMVAKKELRAIPIFGWSMWMAGFVFIDRGDRERAAESIRAAGEKIRSGRSVVYFPEGTRSRDGKLQPFKSGGFRLALAAEVPVVPVGITGSHQVLPKGSLAIRPGTITVRVGAPIEVRGKTREEISREVERAIRSLMAGAPASAAATDAP